MYHLTVHKLAQSVLAYLHKKDLLRAGDRVGIAVSGGADSVALLRLMLELRCELGVVLAVVHLNHQLRAADSDADQSFVCQLAAAHGLEAICKSRDVKAHAAKKKLGLEAAARELRYEFFKAVLGRGTLNKIATAHTADDQAETVLLKLARGAGTRGLAGIYSKVAVSAQPPGVTKTEARDQTAFADTAIIRPLLATRRSELRCYLAEIGQFWREDATNQDLRYRRNRIRQEILPRLEQDVNPSVCNALAETAEIAGAEEKYWAEYVSYLLSQVSQQDQGVLKQRELCGFPLAVRRRLVRAAAESHGLSLKYRQVEEILGLCSEGSCAVVSREWVVVYRGGQLRFQNRPKAASDYEYELPVPGKITISEAGLQFETTLISESQSDPDRSEPLLDSQLANPGLVVRNWRPGEQFWPLHRKEPKKIKELLQDRHITGTEKRLWPVVASENRIVWVRALGIGRQFQAKDNSGVLIRVDSAS